MKVPTYQRQTTRTAEVGARGLSVQASPSAVSAGTRAAQQFFDEATQASLQWYETELTNQRRVQKRKADIASEEEMLAATQQSAEMDPNEAETYFDREMERIKRNYSGQFDNDLQRQNFELDFDKRALAKRVAVRSDASERRIGDALATYETQRDQLQAQVINARTEIDRLVAKEQLDNLFAEIEESGYLTQTDINRQRVASDQFVTKESYIARINGAKSVEAQQAIIEELERFENLPLLPSTLRTLVNKSEDEIAEIMAAENRTKALEDALAAKVSKEQRFALENQIDKMSPADVSAWLDRVSKDDYAALRGRLDISDIRALKRYANAKAENIGATRQAQISRLSTIMDGFEDELAIGILPPQSVLEDAGKAVTYLGNEKSQRRWNEIVENVDEVRLLRSSSPGQVNTYLEDLESDLEEETDVNQRASLSRRIKIVSDYRNNLEAELDKGNHLEFFSQSGQIELTPIDINNMAESFERRRSNIQSIGSILLQGTPEADREEGDEPVDFVNLTRGVNFFTEAEIQEQIAPYIARATSAEKFLLAKALGNVQKFSPDVFSQIDKAGGDSRIFAMAAAIGDFNTAKQVFDGQDQVKQGVVDKPTETETRTVFEKVMGPPGEIYGTDDYKTMQEAALGHYAATRIDRVNFVASELEASIQAVSGGIGEYKGHKVELPRGVNQETFTAWIENLSPRMIEYFAPEGIANMTYEDAADLFKNSRVRSTPGGGYEAIYSVNNQEAVFTENAESLRIFWNDDMARILAEERERPGQDPAISTSRERWLYLNSRPTGFLSNEERVERDELDKEFGRAGDIDILEFRAKTLERQNKKKEAQRLREQIENIKSQQEFFGFGGGD